MYANHTDLANPTDTEDIVGMNNMVDIHTDSGKDTLRSNTHSLFGQLPRVSPMRPGRMGS